MMGRGTLHWQQHQQRQRNRSGDPPPWIKREEGVNAFECVYPEPSQRAHYLLVRFLFFTGTQRTQTLHEAPLSLWFLKKKTERLWERMLSTTFIQLLYVCKSCRSVSPITTTRLGPAYFLTSFAKTLRSLVSSSNCCCCGTTIFTCYVHVSRNPRRLTYLYSTYILIGYVGQPKTQQDEKKKYTHTHINLAVYKEAVYKINRSIPLPVHTQSIKIYNYCFHAPPKR